MTSSRLPQGGGQIRRSPSLRRDARERYLAAAKVAGLDASAIADASAGKSTEPVVSAAASADTLLTEHVRALYEGSVIPVCEIARLIGVSDRMIYQYARRGGWRRRRTCLACAAAFAAAKAGRVARRRPGFVPAKGAGGRFIRREDVGKPFQRGLKAHDPQGAAAAAAACARAGVIAEEAAAAAVADAQARAAREQAAREAQAWMRTFERLMELFVDLAKFRAELGDERSGETAKRAHRLAASLQHAVLTLVDRVWAARAQAPACD
jgi:hypothetical protein